MIKLLKHSGVRSRLAVAAGLAFVAVAAACLNTSAALRAHLVADGASAAALREAQRHLHEHVESGRPDALRAARDELAVPLAAAAVRQSLATGELDPDVLRAALIEARVHPGDVPAMLRLYRVFGDTERFAATAGRRRVSDMAAKALHDVADGLEERGAPTNDRDRRQWHLRIRAAAPVAAAPGQSFAAALDAAGRTVQDVFLAATALFVAALATLVLLPRRVRREPVRARWERAAVAGGVGLFDWDIGADRLRLDSATLSAQGWGGDTAVPVPTGYIRQIVHPEDLPRVRDAVAHARVTRLPWRERFRVLRPDGRDVQVEVSGQMVDGPPGAGPRMLGVVRPIPRAQQTVATEPAPAMPTADRLARIGRELRAPLRGVLAFARLIAADHGAQLPSTQAHRIDQVLRSGTRLLRVVDDVLGQPDWEEGAPARADQPAPRGRVLCIDENPLNVLMLQELLARWPQVELLTADDGETGLMMARTGSPDLVLLDLDLRGSDGLSVLKALQAGGSSPVVVLSAGALAVDRDAAASAGASAFLTKPLAFDQVLAQVRQHLA